VLKHNKTYYRIDYNTKKGTMIIEGPVQSEVLKNLDFHEGLVAFRLPKEQKKPSLKLPRLKKVESLLQEMQKPLSVMQLFFIQIH